MLGSLLSRLLHSLSLVLVMVMASAAPAVAVAGPPPPPPPGVRLGETITAHTDYFHFHMDEEVTGINFTVGEQVTVRATPAIMPPVTVAAAPPWGGFTVPVTFHWRFCGPHASAQPRPVFTADGNEGDHAQTPPSPFSCPLLLSSPTKPMSGPSSTAVTPFSVEGFGFVPGEQITVRARPAVGHAPTPAVPVVADAQGRVRTAVQVHGSLCSTWFTLPLITAVGRAGTSLAAPLSGLPPCPPPATRDPRELSWIGQPPPQGCLLSLQLHPARARLGGMEEAVVRSAIRGQVALAIRYPDGRTRHLDTALSPSGDAIFRWHVPAGGRPGGIHTDLVLTAPVTPAGSSPYQVSLRGRFIIDAKG